MAYSRCSPVNPLARKNSSFHLRYSQSGIVRLPSISVLSPVTLSSSMCFCVIVRSFYPGRISSLTVESAPFVQISTFLLIGFRTITDIRLRIELNSRQANFSNLTICRRLPVPSATQINLFFSPNSYRPYNLAKLIKAIQSGEEELYTSLSPYRSTQIS